MTTGKNRPHTSPFKGCLRGDRYKEPSNRLQAPCRANTKAVLTGVELPPLVYEADNRATGFDIINAVEKAFILYKQAFGHNELIKSFRRPSDILDYNDKHPESPILIVRVAYQHHYVIKPTQATLFDELAKGWQV